MLTSVRVDNSVGELVSALLRFGVGARTGDRTSVT